MLDEDSVRLKEIRQELLTNFERAAIFGLSVAEYGGVTYNVTSDDCIVLIDYDIVVNKDGLLELPMGFDKLFNLKMFSKCAKSVRHIDLGSIIELPVQAFSGFSGLESVRGLCLESISSYCFKGLHIKELYFPNLKSIGYAGLSDCIIDKITFGKYHAEGGPDVDELLSEKGFIDEFSIFGMSMR